MADYVKGKCSCGGDKVTEQKFQFVNNLIKDGVDKEGNNLYTYRDPQDPFVTYKRKMCDSCIKNLTNTSNKPVE